MACHHATEYQDWKMQRMFPGLYIVRYMRGTLFGSSLANINTLLKLRALIGPVSWNLLVGLPVSIDKMS